MTEDFPKPRYELPSTIDLGRMAKGSGACSGGMSDTGTCTQGDAATVDCTAGLAASGTTCSAGNFNVLGGCTGGGSPT